MKKIKWRKWLEWLLIAIPFIFTVVIKAMRSGWVLPITGLLMALVMLEFVRIITVLESKDKGADKHE